MGKGDKKSKKGKRFQHSYGKTRQRKKGRQLTSRKKIEEKSKPVEHKKAVKPEPEVVKPVVVIESRTDEIKINEPVIAEIKGEVQFPEVKETPISEIPELAKVEVVEEMTTDKKEKPTPKTESKKEKEKPAKEAPKKRGRPKKKE